MRDEWTPLFRDLKSRLSGPSRRKLMFQIIGDLQDITVLNFGANGLNRPSEWPQLSEKYAKKYHQGDRTPKLILSDFWHSKINGGKPHLKDAFVHTFDENGAKLTNTAEYADEHLPFTYAVNNSSGIPARPYYPVDISGQNLTPYALGRMRKILDAHFEVKAG